MNTNGIFARTTRNRREIADVLESLDPVQWGAETLCEGWTVRHMAAHFLQPMLVGFGQFFVTSLRYRGNTAATIDHITRRNAVIEPAHLVALLRQHASDEVSPPRVGPMGPFAETCIHLRDIARPLGLAADVRSEDWLDLLPYLTSGKAAASLTTPARIRGLSFRPRGWETSFGAGLEVTGTPEALAMAITGRKAACADLAGSGVDLLCSRG